MPAPHSRVKTDPELSRQLDAAHGTDEPVEAVLMLRPTGKSAAPSTDVRDIAESAIERVEQEVGISPAAVNVLANLGIVVVAAEEPFLRKLLDQPEFASAAANAPDERASSTRDPAPGSSPAGRTTRGKRPAG